MLDLNERLVENKQATFYVRARGDSMIGAGILSGDLLIVDRAREPTDGQIVVARLDDAFTVKRWRRRGRRQFLVPENPEYPRRSKSRATVPSRSGASSRTRFMRWASGAETAA